MNNDCEVCKKLSKDKHRLDFLWKIICVLLFAATIIFGYLYLGSGTINTETSIELGDNSYIGNNVEGNGSIYQNGSIVVGSDDASINNTTNKVDNTPIIVISGIAIVAILIIGGIVYANYHKKDD